MEAYVWAGTGLLPENLEAIRLTALADGRWEAMCDFDAGDTRTLQFAPSEQAQAQIAGALRSQLGFSPHNALETARRLFEPFDLAAEWPW